MLHGKPEKDWAQRAVFYQIYPMGFCGAPFENDGVAVNRIQKVKEWIPHLEKLGIETDKRGCVVVDDHLRTKYPHIYAIGDLVRGPMLAHKAEDEGMMVAELIKTGHGHVNYDVIPGVVYTEPEIAMVGKTEAQLKNEGVEYTKGSFPLQANSRARAYDQPDGLIKVLADKKTSWFWNS